MKNNISSNKFLDFIILINLLLIIATLIIFERSNIDVELQNLFFDFENKKWLIDRDEPVKKFIFYNFPKILLGAVIVTTILAFFLSFKEKKFPTLKNYRHKILLFLLGLTLIPLTVGNIKKFTNVYCPDQLKIYNGSYPYVRVLEKYPPDFTQEKKGQCFPAGHAVTGFCLMILFFVFEKKSYRIAGLFLGLIMGWVLGNYQMLKGDHFLSHTFTTMLASFLVATIIVRFFTSYRPKFRKS